MHVELKINVNLILVVTNTEIWLDQAVQVE
jgi:hypothetical protein